MLQHEFNAEFSIWLMLSRLLAELQLLFSAPVQVIAQYVVQ